MTSSIKLVKVFSATMARDRAVLGERITAWVQEHPEIRVARFVTAQSSDMRFHCISIVLFCTDARTPTGELEPPVGEGSGVRNVAAQGG